MNKLKKFINKNKEIINYLIVGGLTTVVSYLSYAFVSRILGFDYKLSTVLSWVCAVLFAYFANKTVVFKSKSTSKKHFFIEVVNFFKYRVLSLIIDMILMIILVSLLSINDLIAKIIVQFIIVAINYVFSKFFVFNKK